MESTRRRYAFDETLNDMFATLDPGEIMRVFDVPPWVVGPYRKPRFVRIRWALRRWWKIKAEPIGPQPLGLYQALEKEEEAFVERMQKGLEAMERQWEREPFSR